MTVPPTDKAADLPYRAGVGAVLFNPDGLVWVGQRAGGRYPKSWQMPQGGIDAGETPEQALWREMVEETGTDKAVILAETERWLTYELPPALVGVAWKGRYRGQKQKWFALRFTGDDSDIDLETHAKPEFSAWRWVELATLPGLIVPFKQAIYREIVDAFGHLPDRIRDDA